MAKSHVKIKILKIKSNGRLLLSSSSCNELGRGHFILTINKELNRLENQQLFFGSVRKVAMYGCESWTTKKAEHWTDAFALWCWRRLLSALDSEAIQPVHPKVLQCMGSQRVGHNLATEQQERKQVRSNNCPQDWRNWWLWWVRASQNRDAEVETFWEPRVGALYLMSCCKLSAVNSSFKTPGKPRNRRVQIVLWDLPLELDQVPLRLPRGKGKRKCSKYTWGTLLSIKSCPQEKLVSSWLLGVIWPSCTFRKATPTSSLPVPPEWGGKASETESYISRGLSGSLVTETWLQDYRMRPLHTYLAVAFSHPVVSDSLWPCGLQPARLLSPWGFSRHEYWSGLSCPSPGDLPNPGVKLASSAFQADSSPAELSGKPPCTSYHHVTKGFFMGFHGDSDSKESVCNAGDPSLIPGLEDPLEKGMATHSSILTWRIYQFIMSSEQ